MVGFSVETEFNMNKKDIHFKKDGTQMHAGVLCAAKKIIQGAIFLIAAHAHFCWAKDCFDAKTRFTATQAGSTHGALVYVWSPRMVLSAQYAADAQQQAARAGLRWQPVHDPQVPDDERLAALQKLAHAYPENQLALQTSQPLCDAQLIDRDALRHFPTAFVWRDAPHLASASAQANPPTPGWAGHPIVGAMPAAFWATALRERLQP
jgi:hypothetical protein